MGSFTALHCVHHCPTYTTTISLLEISHSKPLSSLVALHSCVELSGDPMWSKGRGLGFTASRFNVKDPFGCMKFLPSMGVPARVDFVDKIDDLRVCRLRGNVYLKRNFLSSTECILYNRFCKLRIGRPIQGIPSWRVGTCTAAFDSELHTVLELASDAELFELSNILYGKSLLSPLLKSIAPGDGSNRGSIAEAMHEKDHGGRDALMERLESRFMFLAADAKATLSGRRPTYREVLLQVRTKLHVPCSIKLSTEDLEAEIFLHLLQNYSSKPKTQSQKRRRAPSLAFIARARGGHWRENVSTAIRLGREELLSVFLKGSSAVTMSTLQGIVAKDLSGKVLLETARYQLAKEALVKGGQAVAAKLESQVAMLVARQTLAGAAARYMTLRSTMMMLGPLLWGTFLADIVIRAVGTDYARVVRAIYAFAQIRLSRTHGWTRADVL